MDRPHYHIWPNVAYDGQGKDDLSDANKLAFESPGVAGFYGSEIAHGEVAKVHHAPYPSRKGIFSVNRCDDTDCKSRPGDGKWIAAKRSIPLMPSEDAGEGMEWIWDAVAWVGRQLAFPLPLEPEPLEPEPLPDTRQEGKGLERGQDWRWEAAQTIARSRYGPGILNNLGLTKPTPEEVRRAGLDKIKNFHSQIQANAVTATAHEPALSSVKLRSTAPVLPRPGIRLRRLTEAGGDPPERWHRQRQDRREGDPPYSGSPSR